MERGRGLVELGDRDLARPTVVGIVAHEFVTSGLISQRELKRRDQTLRAKVRARTIEAEVDWGREGGRGRGREADAESTKRAVRRKVDRAESDTEAALGGFRLEEPVSLVMMVRERN